MGLVIAYFLVWLFLVLYVARLDARQRALEQTAETLEARLAQANRQPKTARAA